MFKHYCNHTRNVRIICMHNTISYTQSVGTFIREDYKYCARDPRIGDPRTQAPKDPESWGLCCTAADILVEIQQAICATTKALRIHSRHYFKLYSELIILMLVLQRQTCTHKAHSMCHMWMCNIIFCACLCMLLFPVYIQPAWPGNVRFP